MFIALRNKYLLAAALLTILTINVPLLAAPQTVESFDKTTWSKLVRQMTRPAIVVFSSVTCTHCPGTIDKIAAALAAARSRTQLVIISMDSEYDAGLLRDGHSSSANRLYAFNGAAQPLQYSVNPAWRGMTPYIAYFDGSQKVRFVLGEPKQSELQAWVAAGR